MKVNQEKTKSRRTKDGAAHHAGWVRATRALCRLGHHQAKVEGSRFSLNASHYRIIQPFETIRWIGWTIGNLCCRIAPACAMKFFQADQKHIQKIRLGSRCVSLHGDEPVDIPFRSKGRLSLPAHITGLLKILKEDQVIILPRMGFLEIWRLSQWESMFNARSSASMEIINGDSTPTSPNPARVSPSPHLDVLPACVMKSAQKGK